MGAVWSLFGRVAGLFSFTGRLTLVQFLISAAYYGGTALLLWAIQLSGVLSADIARGNELLWLYLVIVSVPLLALMTRRLADTVFPAWLILAVPAAFGLASASVVIGGWPTGQTIFTWAGYGMLAALGLGLVWSSRASQGAAQ